MFRRWGLGASLLVAVFSGLSCGQESTSPHHDTPAALGSTREASSAAVGDEINPRLLRRFQPLPPVSAGAKDEVDLGRMLFFDTRLSMDNDLSCSSCHTLSEYGVDHRKTSVGHNGQVGTRNAPSVYNTGGHFAHFWDGRATDLEDQAKMPILNPTEMGMPSSARVVDTLKAIPGYVEAFKRAFPNDADALTYDNLGRAIGAFERGLVTPGRWDLYLEGDRNALTEPERAGLKTFLNSGCMVCHTGAYVGGSMFERAGAVEPWPNQSDQGRFEVTHVAADKMMFKVPSLRNVEKTAPYFHDGSVATLDDAVRMMGKHQLGIDLADDEVSSIVTWLKSLTGTIPQSYIARPELPKSPGGTNLIMIVRAALVVATVWVSGLGCVSSSTDHESTSDDTAKAPSIASVESPAPSASAVSSSSHVSYPLHDWMKANAATSLAARDSKRLAHAMHRLVSMGPPGFDSWPQLAERGATAAEASDFAGARAVCSECHDKYRPDYKKSYRQRALSND